MFYSWYLLSFSIVTNTVQTDHKTNSTVFISLPAVPDGGRAGRGALSALSFHIIISSGSVGLTLEGAPGKDVMGSLVGGHASPLPRWPGNEARHLSSAAVAHFLPGSQPPSSSQFSVAAGWYSGVGGCGHGDRGSGKAGRRACAQGQRGNTGSQVPAREKVT